MEVHVVQIEIDATVGGDLLDVESATITLGVNAIPRIELVCPPSKLGTASGVTALHPHVEVPGIKDFADLYRELAKKAEGLQTKGTVDIRVIDNKGGTDSIQLYDWVLTDVGLSSAGATAAPQMVVVLQHRICELTKAGSVYETPKDNIHELFAFAPVLPFTELVDWVYNAVQPDTYWWPSDNAFPPIYRHALPKFTPIKYLVDKTGGTFLRNDGHVDPKRMAESEARMILPTDNGTSTWDMLIRMCGTLLTSITQDQGNNYTKDKLVFEPTSNWRDASITLKSERCCSTDLFGRDPFKLAGVMSRKLGPYTDPVNLGIWKVANMKTRQKMNRETMFVPKPYNNVPDADGRVIKTSPPVLLEQQNWDNAPKGDNIVSMTVDKPIQRMMNWQFPMEKYCKALYELTATSMARGSAKMALSFHESGGGGGNLILPGNTCKFVAGNDTLYYGYIRQVVHYMSTSGGNSTTVAMSNLRPDPPYKKDEDVIIPTHDQNAAWETNW